MRGPILHKIGLIKVNWANFMPNKVQKKDRGHLNRAIVNRAILKTK